MANRYKPENGKIECIEDVEQAFTEIRKAETELYKIDSSADVQCAKIREKAASDGEKFRNAINAVVAKIQAYAEYNREELFAKSKSLELENGTFGYRQSTKVNTKKTTLELLHELINTKTLMLKEASEKEEKAKLKEELAKLADCVKTEEKLQKKAIGELSAADMLAIGAAKIIEDQFFCETKKEEVNQNLLKAGA